MPILPHNIGKINSFDEYENGAHPNNPPDSPTPTDCHNNSTFAAPGINPADFTASNQSPSKGHDCLKSYPGLNQYIIAKGLSSLYRLWLICRDIDIDGRGVISMTDLRAQLDVADLGIAHIKRARSHAQCHTFFSFHQHKVEYRSLEAVCVALGVKPGRCIHIPKSCLSSTESFRATLYSAWIASHDDLFISRERLSNIFSVSADTLRRWERITNVNVNFNVVEVATADTEAANAYVPQDARLDHLDRLGHSYVWEYQGSLYYRSVNNYQAPKLSRGRTGNTRNVAKAVNRAVIPVYDHGDGNDQSEPRRVFYTRQMIPQNYQEQPGACLIATRKIITTSRGSSALWQFSQWKPVNRNQAMLMDH